MSILKSRVEERTNAEILADIKEELDELWHRAGQSDYNNTCDLNVQKVIEGALAVVNAIESVDTTEFFDRV